MIDREPPRWDGAVRYIYWDLRFAHSLCDYIRASEYIYAFEKKPNEHSFSSWSIECYTARMNIDLSVVLTLFFYHHRCDVYSFHYFRISALKATLRVSNPLISVSLSSSLCMRLHFLLGWNVPNRSFFCPSVLLRWYGSWLESFVYTANRPRFVSNPSCAAEVGDIGETRMWPERGPQELKRSISINSRFFNLLSHYMYLSC